MRPLVLLTYIWYSQQCDNLEFLEIFVVPSIKFHARPSSGSHADPHGQSEPRREVQEALITKYLH